MGRVLKNTVPIKRIGPGKTSADLSVVILAAGPSKNDRFKYNRSIIRFDDGQTLIYKQISAIYQEFPKSEVVVVTGYGSDDVIKEIYNYTSRTRIVENERFATTNSFRSACLGIRVVTTPNLLVINGDIFFKTTALKHITNNHSSLLIDDKKIMSDSEVGVIANDSIVTNLSYGLDTKWCQVAFLKEKELGIMRKLSYDRDNDILCFFEGLNLIIENDGEFRTVKLDTNEFVEIDYPRDIKKVGIN